MSQSFQALKYLTLCVRVDPNIGVYIKVSTMEDDLSYRRQPLLWKTTSPWKMTSPMEDDLFYGRLPLPWKMTSHMEVNLSYGRSRGHSPWELLTLNSGIFLYSPYCQMFLVTWFFWLGEGRIKKGVGLDPRIRYFGVYGILAAKQVIWNKKKSEICQE